jgi:hypothetical protein
VLVQLYVWTIAALALYTFVTSETLAPLAPREVMAMLAIALLASALGSASAVWLWSPGRTHRLVRMAQENGVYLSIFAALGFVVIGLVAEAVSLWPFAVWFLPATLASTLMFLGSPRWQRNDG